MSLRVSEITRFPTRGTSSTCSIATCRSMPCATPSRGPGAWVFRMSSLRVDYFALPFRRSIDRLLCLDTLIRGEDHEKALLNEIAKAIASDGRAIVDFHHWWHNPLRRLGVLPQNFGNNRSYTRSGAEGLLRECGVEGWRLVRFCQEFAPEGASLKRLSWLLPATRLLYEFGSAASGHARASVETGFSTTCQPDPSDAAR